MPEDKNSPAQYRYTHYTTSGRKIPVFAAIFKNNSKFGNIWFPSSSQNEKGGFAESGQQKYNAEYPFNESELLSLSEFANS